MIGDITPAVLEELSQHITQSLLNVFSIMFDIQLIANKTSTFNKRSPAFRATIEIRKDDFSACLNVAILTGAMNALTKTIPPDNDLSEEKFSQDMACEIANIVGYTIRNFFNSSERDVVVGLPHVGVPQQNADEKNVLTLSYSSRVQDAVCLDFVYPKRA